MTRLKLKALTTYAMWVQLPPLPISSPFFHSPPAPPFSSLDGASWSEDRSEAVRKQWHLRATVYGPP